jgi:chromosome segregation ATPase
MRAEMQGLERELTALAEANRGLSQDHARITLELGERNTELAAGRESAETYQQDFADAQQTIRELRGEVLAVTERAKKAYTDRCFELLNMSARAKRFEDALSTIIEEENAQAIRSFGLGDIAREALDAARKGTGATFESTQRMADEVRREAEKGMA